MKETGKTLVFVASALILMGAALLASIPRVRSVNDFSDQGTTFYPDFKDPSACTSLEVVEFDPSTAEARPFKVMLKDGRWVIPSHDNYPADAKDRLARAAGSLIGLTKDTIRSSRSEDHAALGVIDPTAVKVTNIDGAGRKITLRDRSDRVLADFILGKDVPGRPGMKFVRRPDQVRTYGVKVQAEPSARFADWIEPNLLQAQASQFRKATFDNSKVDAARGEIVAGESLTISRPDAAAPWTLPGLDPGQEVDPAKASAMVNALADLKIVGVRPKPAALSALLKGEGSSGVNRSSLESLQSKGFYVSQKRGLLSDEGSLRAWCEDGVMYDLKFGRVTFAKGETLSSGKGEDADKPKDLTKPEDAGIESRYLFVTAVFDPSSVPVPKTKPDAKGGELPANVFSRTAAESKAEDDRIAREKADFDRKVKEGTARAAELTNRFAPWYYVVPGDAYRSMVLDRKALVHAKTAARPPGAANPFGGGPRFPGLAPSMPAGHP
jgi:hypothetical protein